MLLGVRLAAACLLAAAAGVVPISSAEAATCSSGDGVSVVVDFHELGGGVQTACVADGGGDSAASLFTAAGFGLTYVQRQPGFVCRVSGAPADEPCVSTPPADAYWGLWSSDGDSGQWTYASRGVGTQTVPDGGYVALSWNGSSSRSTPGIAPAAHPVAPPPSTTPTSKPSHQSGTRPSGKPSASPTKHAPGTSSTAPTEPSASSPSNTPSATPTATDEKSGKPDRSSTSPSAAATETSSPSVSSSASDAPVPTASDPSNPSDGGLPTWVGPVVVVLLFAAGGAVAVVRRRGNAAP